MGGNISLLQLSVQILVLVELNWRSIKPEVKGELGLLGSSQRRIELAEYLLWLQMKQRRGDLADFLRGLTPGLV